MKFYSKQGLIKNYFTLPNEIFNLNLSAGEIALYAYLLRCKNRKTYKCYPSYKTIGKSLGMSKNTVKKYVDSLQEKRLIDTAYTFIYSESGKKSNGNLMYTILPIREAINYELEQQIKKNEVKNQ